MPDLLHLVSVNCQILCTPIILLFLPFDSRMFGQTNLTCKIWHTFFLAHIFFSVGSSSFWKNKSSELSNSLKSLSNSSSLSLEGNVSFGRQQPFP